MTPTKTKTIVAVFSNSATAQRATQDLLQSGFSREDVQITSNDTFASDAARGNIGLSGADPTRHSTGGGISGFFRNLFGAGEDEDTTYANAIRSGGAIVSVRTNEGRTERAQDILERYDPIDIDKTSGASDKISGASRQQVRADDTGTDRSIPVVEEQLHVGKRAVQRGGVRVYSHIVEQPVEEQVSLREERVHVDRRRVDRPATEADFRPPEQVVEVTETVEEPVIGKQARVREEIVVGKEARTRTETVKDSVRRTDVNVEKMGSADRMVQEHDDDFRRDFTTRYGSTKGSLYDTYAPAYQYGYSSGTDKRFSGRKWEDVEETLRTDYMRNNPNSTWDQVKGAVRYGWEKVTRQR